MGQRKDYAKMAGKKSRKPRVSRPTAQAVRAIAKSVIRKEAEDKFVSVAQDQSFNSTITSPAECYPVMPAISIGTGDFQRIGDKVRGKYLYVKGHIQYNKSYIDNPLVNNYLPPSTVRVMILSQKNIKCSNLISSRVDTQHLLKDNIATGTARPYNGSMMDNLSPINKDLFTVHFDKKVKMDALYQTSDGAYFLYGHGSGN